MKEIDDEVERRLRRMGEKKGRWRHVEARLFSQTIAQKPATHKVKPEVLSPREPLTDIFDEGDHLMIIAELPGVEEKDIKVDLKDDKLTISADAEAHRYHQVVSLSCIPEGEPNTTYRNGVLKIIIKKWGV